MQPASLITPAIIVSLPLVAVAVAAVAALAAVAAVAAAAACLEYF